MQHLDEGTIHSWLDGALAPEEAARVEAHAAECAVCAAAVAEARGFIAASSRILTSLDNAPRGVIPVATPKKRFDPFVWKVAATLLVVAGGTLVVARTRGADQHPATTASDTRAAATTATPPVAFRVNGPETVPNAAVVKPPTVRSDAARKVIVERPPNATPAPAEAPIAGVAGDRRKAANGAVAQSEQRFGAAGSAQAVGAMSAPAAIAPLRAADVATADRAGNSASPRVIGEQRRIGANVTVYEIDGDTVTLTESKPVSLENVVTTGAVAGKQPQKAEPGQAVTLNAPVPSAAAPAASAAPMQKAADSGNVITWLDPATNSTLTLKGRVSVARLVELKARIEREKAAAAAAAKKTR